MIRHHTRVRPLMFYELEEMERQLETGLDVEDRDEDGTTRLHRASKAADLQLVKLLLRFGADVSARTQDGRRPMHCAAIQEEPEVMPLRLSKARPEIMQALLAAGAQLDAQDDCGDTPLSIAYRYGLSFCVEFLLIAGADPALCGELGHCPPSFVVNLVLDRDGAATVKRSLAHSNDVNAKDADGNTLLDHACWLGSAAAIIALLAAGACPRTRGRRSFEATPLHYAAEMMERHGGVRAVAALVMAGADVNALDAGGYTPLMRSAKCGSPSAVRVLMQFGACVSFRDRNRFNPLHSACDLIRHSGGAQVVVALIKSGVDINAADNDLSITPLCVAVSHGAASTVHLLLKYGADPNLGGSQSISPICFAPELLGEPEGMKALAALLDAGADINTGGDRQWAPLLYAAIRQPQLAAIPALLDLGANPCCQTSTGLTALHFAGDIRCHSQGVEAIRALVNAGADTNAADMGGYTPLHLAVGANSNVAPNPSAVQLLLRLGADPLRKDNKGLSPLHFAPILMGHFDGAQAIAAMVEAGADINTMDNDENTPLHLAAAKGCPLTTEVLLRHGADPGIRGSKGRTPLHWAAQSRVPQDAARVIEALCEAGADPNARTNSRLVPLDLTVIAGTFENARLLLKFGADIRQAVPDSLPLHYYADQLMELQDHRHLILSLKGLRDSPWSSGDGLHPHLRRGSLGFSEGLQSMQRIRHKMLSLPCSEHPRYVAVLSEIYAICKFYPFYPAIHECEIEISKQRPSFFGGFADCWEGVFLGQFRVAMKTPRGHIPDEIAKRRIAREMNILQRLEHPNILPFIGIFSQGPASYLISPWMKNGNALKYVQRNPEVNCVSLLTQISEGLAYLHGREPLVVHGDLRAENILISDDGNACITDFGLSELVMPLSNNGVMSAPSTAWYVAGNPRWQAAEVLVAETKEEARRTKETDIFAFGRVMIELFTRDVPFCFAAHDGAVLMAVARGILPERPLGNDIVARGLNDAMWDLMTQCWDIDPTKRPSAENIVARLKSVADVVGGDDLRERERDLTWHASTEDEQYWSED